MLQLELSIENNNMQSTTNALSNSVTVDASIICKTSRNKSVELAVVLSEKKKWKVISRW